MTKQEPAITGTTTASTMPSELLEELRIMIDRARTSVATVVNFTLAMLYWNIGNRVRREILKDKRAEYGQSIVSTVSRQLTQCYGKGFSDKSLRRMIHFGETFPDEQIVSTLLRQLSWSHFILLIPSTKQSSVPVYD